MDDAKMKLKPENEVVPAAEFARKFGRYKMQAQRGPVAVSSNGTLAGYFVAVEEFEELQKLKAMRRHFVTAELTDAEVEQLSSAQMDPRHDHLNKLLDPS
jgi:PHD/YefM family antitoxin component YafN of YafNO toxin-antitoxin module